MHSTVERYVRILPRLRCSRLSHNHSAVAAASSLAPKHVKFNTVWVFLPLPTVLQPVSRGQILRHARGQGNIIFPAQLTTSRIGNLTRLIHTLLYVMTIHKYIHTYLSFKRHFLPVFVVKMKGKHGGCLPDLVPGRVRVRVRSHAVLPYVRAAAVELVLYCWCTSCEYRLI